MTKQLMSKEQVDAFESNFTHSAFWGSVNLAALVATLRAGLKLEAANARIGELEEEFRRRWPDHGAVDSAMDSAGVFFCLELVRNGDVAQGVELKFQGQVALTWSPAEGLQGVQLTMHLRRELAQRCAVYFLAGLEKTSRG